MNIKWEEEHQRHTSLTISLTSVFPKALLRSPCFATSPLDTFTKTLLICRTSSKFVSLPNDHFVELYEIV